MRDATPSLLVADRAGRVITAAGLGAAGRSALTLYPMPTAWLIPLPAGSHLYLLPGRVPLAFDSRGAVVQVPGRLAVAAFLPPGYTLFAHPAFRRLAGAPELPLHAYSAVCRYRGRLCVPATRVDRDPKHDPAQFSYAALRRRVRARIRRSPWNRLLLHHGLICALDYGCPNAQNLFLGRWEAPAAVARACNAACVGCISKQPARGVPEPQHRIHFVPTLEEILDLAVPHLRTAPRAMVSFGQGCEGEPLLQADLIERAIRAIRAQTRRGTLHLNTNGSRPRALKRLIEAGLDSVRISLNSARPALYAAYYRPRGYGFADVVKSLELARDMGAWVSINYFVFPGVTDDARELAAMRRLLARTRPNMIQWRNLNIDPDACLAALAPALGQAAPRLMGVPEAMARIAAEFPDIRFGYLNPPVPPSQRRHARPGPRPGA